MNDVNGLVIVIDGPSGSGKSSTARGVAQRLDLAYLDTGAMYRAIAWEMLERGVDPSDPDAVADLARTARLELSHDPADQYVRVNGVDVTTAIREPRISANVSKVATNLAVREHLVAEQRRRIVDARATGGIVAEGRDLTTVVAPDAEVRVLLVADADARVARRRAELAGAAPITQEQVTDQIVRRDRDDSTVAAFTDAAPGVTVIDSTRASLDEVVDRVIALAPTAPPSTSEE